MNSTSPRSAMALHVVSECNVHCLVQFAEAACGVVQVMLNGSVEAGAFRSSRYSLNTFMFLWCCVWLSACESQCKRDFATTWML